MMENPEGNDENRASASLARWQRLLERTTLAFCGACSGVVLSMALFPAFYYLSWIFVLPLYWGLIALACLGQFLVLSAIARREQVPLPFSPWRGTRFMVGLLVMVTLLAGFKVPLHASFLLAKPELEDALASHADELDQIGRSAKYYHCGIYPIGKAHRRCHKKDRIYFRFRNDGESAIIYSESGIGDLCYNAGAKGRFFGNWYWMKED